jgi:probable phosphoglycerate mutase
VRTLHVVTHPAATHHIEQLVGGWYDSDLTPAGMRAATAIAAALRAEIPNGTEVEVVTSDLIRARRTAEEIALAFGVHAVLDRRLRKRSFGAAEGKPRAWRLDRFVPPPVTGEQRLDHVASPGEESIRSVAGRAYAAMAEILARPCRRQIIVTHGGTLSYLVACWIGMPLESVGRVAFRSVPGGITTLREDDRYHNREVVALGDSRHLTP